CVYLLSSSKASLSSVWNSSGSSFERISDEVVGQAAPAQAQRPLPSGRPLCPLLLLVPSASLHRVVRRARRQHVAEHFAHAYAEMLGAQPVVARERRQGVIEHLRVGFVGQPAANAFQQLLIWHLTPRSDGRDPYGGRPPTEDTTPDRSTRIAEWLREGRKL